MEPRVTGRMSHQEREELDTVTPTRDAAVLPFTPQLSALEDPIERAFSGLYVTRYGPLVRYAIAEVGDDDAAADVVQGAFAALWAQHYRSARSVPQNADGLAYTIVRNRIALHQRGAIRRKKVFRIYAQRWMRRVKNWMLPDEFVEHAALVQVVDDALQNMTPRSREVFLLRRESELSFKEIAAMTGVSVSTINNLMHKAQLELRKHVNRAGFGAEAQRRTIAAATRS